MYRLHLSKPYFLYIQYNNTVQLIESTVTLQSQVSSLLHIGHVHKDVFVNATRHAVAVSNHAVTVNLLLDRLQGAGGVTLDVSI